jgi:hypothetical protein
VRHAAKICLLRSIGLVFYSVNYVSLYWEYEAVATVYQGFTLENIKSLPVRERDFWVRMAKHRYNTQ